MPDDDIDLLRLYVAEKSEAAFTELVQRRLDLVYSVALQQVNGNAALAEEVAQAVFTLLARKAAALTGRPVIGGWLYRTTQCAAIDAIRADNRRRRRETQAELMHSLEPDPAASVDWDKLRPTLERAIGELRDEDRDAIVLRFFEGKSFADVGTRLRLTENAARMRVERALEKLRRLLAQRGITSTASALAAALANQAVTAAPAGLVASIAAAALHGVVATGAGFGSAAVVFSFMNTTSVTLGLLGVLAISTAVYQSSQARASNVALGEARNTDARMRVELSELQSRVQNAERELARQSSTPSASTAATDSRKDSSRAPEEAQAARGRALQQFLDSDPQLQTLRQEDRRARFLSGHGRFLKSFGLSDQQVQDAAELFVQTAPTRNSPPTAGVDSVNRVLDDNEAFRANLRARFGDAIADRFDDYLRNFAATRQVSAIATALYHLDEPLTAEQSKRLTAICAESRLPDAAGIMWGAYSTLNRSFLWNDANVRLDWERVLAQSAPFLSPAQMQVIRSMAARARLDAQVAAVAQRAAQSSGR